MHKLPYQINHNIIYASYTSSDTSNASHIPISFISYPSNTVKRQFSLHLFPKSKNPFFSYLHLFVVDSHLMGFD